MTSAAIEVEGLTCRFGEHVALDGVDLAMPAGSVLAVLGPNGAGKTTIVRILATLQRPTGGRARVFDHDVVRHAHRVRTLVGLTGQYAAVDEDLTARENLMLFARLVGLSRPACRRRTVELLEEFSLGEAADRAIKGFSGGMRRRLDLAASLVARPPLLFLDEPTTGLDPRTRVQMWDTVRALVEGGSSVLLTTQYLEEADQLADRIAVIDRGRVVADGTADQLKSMVAASTLRVVPQDLARVAQARQVVESVLDRTATVVQGREVMVALDDRRGATAVLIALQENGIEVEEIAMQKPSLDEVFFSLTGGRTAA